MAQFNATRAAAIRLAQAHIELGKAELGEILDNAKVMVAGFGVAFVALLYAVFLLAIGLSLFLGEWLFGSLGWGVLHGIEWAVVFAIVGVLIALWFPTGIIVRGFALGLVLGVLFAIVFGLNLPHEGWSRLGELFPGLAPETRPLVVAVAFLATIFGVLGFIFGARLGGVQGAIAGVILGALLGAILGAFTAATWPPQAAAGLGVAVGLAAWAIAMGVSAQRHGVDVEALKARLYPNATIDTTKETIEWVRQQTPLGRKS